MGEAPFSNTSQASGITVLGTGILQSIKLCPTELVRRKPLGAGSHMGQAPCCDTSGSSGVLFRG